MLNESAIIEANITSLESVLYSTRRAVRDLGDLVANFSLNVSKAVERAAVTVDMARDNAKIGREASVASKRVESGVSKFNISLSATEGEIAAMPNVPEVVRNVSGYYLWANELKANITGLTLNNWQGKALIQGYHDAVRAAVNRTMAAMITDVTEQVDNRSGWITTYGDNLFWNLTRPIMPPTRNETIGGWPVAPIRLRHGRADSEKWPGCHGCNY